MMAKLLHPLLLLVARATEKELVRMVEYLKAGWEKDQLKDLERNEQIAGRDHDIG